MAQGAAMMTDDAGRHGHDHRLGHGQATSTSPSPKRCTKNIQNVGMPKWDENDITLAKGLQKELGVREAGLETSDRLDRSAP